MSLNPTPGRLRTLQSIADGKVARYGNDKSYEEAWRDVTHQTFLMEQAGWIVLGAEIFPGKCRWALTDEGRRIVGGDARAVSTNRE